MRFLFICICLLALIGGMALAADNPATSPAAPVAVTEPVKSMTPLELYRDLETQQVGFQTKAQQLQVEYDRLMKELQTAYDQAEGAKKLLLAQNPGLEKELQAKAAEKPAEKPKEAAPAPTTPPATK